MTTDLGRIDYCILVACPQTAEGQALDAIQGWKDLHWDHPLVDSSTWGVVCTHPDEAEGNVRTALLQLAQDGPANAEGRVLGLIIVGQEPERIRLMDALEHAAWSDAAPMSSHEAGPAISEISKAIDELLETLSSKAGSPDEKAVPVQDIERILNPVESAARGAGVPPDEATVTKLTRAAGMEYRNDSQDVDTSVSDDRAWQLGQQVESPVTKEPTPRKGWNTVWSRLTGGPWRKHKPVPAHEVGVVLFAFALDSRTQDWGGRAFHLTEQVLKLLSLSEELTWQAGMVKLDDRVTVMAAPRAARTARAWFPEDVSLGFLLDDAVNGIRKLLGGYVDALQRRSFRVERTVVVWFTGQYPLIDTAGEESHLKLVEESEASVWIVFGAQDTMLPRLFNDPPASVIFHDHDDLAEELLHTVFRPGRREQVEPHA